MNRIRKKNNVIRLKHLLWKVCEIALHDLDVLLEKRIRSRPWILRRKERGSSALLLEEIRCEDIGQFKSIPRKTPDTSDVLLSRVASKIQRINTKMREAVPEKVMSQHYALADHVPPLPSTR